MVKVLVSDRMSSRAISIFRDRGIEVDERYDLDAQQLLDAIPEYDGIAVRSSTKLTADAIDGAEKLKVIGRAGIGVDNINVAAATAKGVVVMNAPFGNSITTAEHAIAMMLALARHIPQADQSTQVGRWEKSKFLGVEVSGKTLGIIGCGNVGSIVADRAQGLRMKVLAYDPYLSAERATELGVEKSELDELLGRADFISLHAPLTDSTRGVINAETLAKTKVGARVINCARGGLIVEEALKEALETGRLAGAALDVFAEEPAGDNALFGLENLIATPHLGASTTEAQENVASQIAEQMSDYLLLGAVSNALNMPAVSAEDAPKLRPYMALASQLGNLVGQIVDKGLQTVTIEFSGLVTALNTRPLTSIALEGLLSQQLNSVNMVNAPVIARERNIVVREVSTELARNYQTLIRLIVETDDQIHDVSGTLFSDQNPRVVEIDGIKIEAELGQHMIYVSNDDKPGIIGNLGTTLGDVGVNIATFHLGRVNQGGDAMALIAVDDVIQERVLKKLRELSHVKQVRALHFE
jgi:D-3-phosphoglycerate dehydrogenase